MARSYGGVERRDLPTPERLAEIGRAAGIKFTARAAAAWLCAERPMPFGVQVALVDAMVDDLWPRWFERPGEVPRAHAETCCRACERFDHDLPGAGGGVVITRCSSSGVDMDVRLAAAMLLGYPATEAGARTMMRGCCLGRLIEYLAARKAARGVGE